VFDDVFEAFECVGPELRENRTYGVEGVGIEHVEAAGAVASFVEQPGPVQDLQVVADGLLGDLEMPGYLAGGELATADEAEDLAALWIGECAQNGIRGRDGVDLTVGGPTNSVHGIQDRTWAGSRGLARALRVR